MNREHAGYTLVEVLAVVVLAGTIAAAVGARAVAPRRDSLDIAVDQLRARSLEATHFARCRGAQLGLRPYGWDADRDETIPQLRVPRDVTLRWRDLDGRDLDGLALDQRGRSRDLIVVCTCADRSASWRRLGLTGELVSEQAR